MAFGSGTRQWVRGQLAKIAASTVVLGQGEMLVDEAGGLYGGDGVTQIKNLNPAVTPAKMDNGGAFLKPVRVPTLVVDQAFPSVNTDARIVWVDGTLMYAVGWEAAVYKSTDSGVTWTFKSRNVNVGALVGTFLVTSNGNLLTFASGSPGTVYISTNDGVTWTLAMTMQASCTPLGATSWCVDPLTDYIYVGEYRTADTDTNPINVYRSTDHGVTWSVFHAFPGYASGDPLKIRHIHSIRWDSVQGRIIVLAGDSDPAAGMYRVNTAGTDLEPMILNSNVPLPDSSEGARAIGLMDFPDYIAWTGDATSNPYLMRMARTELGKSSMTVQRVYRLNSAGWFSIKAKADGTKWVFSSSAENASNALDRSTHLYAVEDQGATVYEVAAFSPGSENQTAAIAPVGRADNIGTGDKFWLQTHNTSANPAQWGCRLGRGTTQALQPARARPLVYAYQTMNTPGSIYLPGNSELVFGRDITPSTIRNLQIFNAGLVDDAGTSTTLRIRVRKTSDGSILYESFAQNSRRALAETAASIATVAMTAADAIEFVLVNTSTSVAHSGTAYVTYGWGF